MWNEVNKTELEEEVHFPVKCSEKEIEELVELYRLQFYNREMPCGAGAIRNKLEKLCVRPLPSVCTINRILSKRCLTNKRTGYYEEDYVPIGKN